MSDILWAWFFGLYFLLWAFVWLGPKSWKRKIRIHLLRPARIYFLRYVGRWMIRSGRFIEPYAERLDAFIGRHKRAFFLAWLAFGIPAFFIGFLGIMVWAGMLMALSEEWFFRRFSAPIMAHALLNRLSAQED